ncbi:hypothetical protein [Pseudomonas savastanoi]|nr:hypothetical protein [Pseudomonas savastanoi]
MALSRGQKMAVGSFFNGVGQAKFVGAGAFFHVPATGYYIDPNNIGGWQYDPSTGGWWSHTPANLGDLPYPADPGTSAELERLRKIYEQHNNLEGLKPTDPVPNEDPLLTPGFIIKMLEKIYGETLEFKEKLKKKFGEAGETVSPIILDLNGDGVKTVGLDSDVHFDHDGNGFSELTGWVSQEDALLVYDRNNNNAIDDGGELFGSNYILDGAVVKNGFEALAEFDSNNDGVVDGKDEGFSKLKVWKDKSADAIVNDGELISLAEAGISSLSLQFRDDAYVDENGNQHRQLGSFVRADGVVGAMTDVWFQQDKADTEARNYLDVTHDVSVLPDLIGFGNVDDLHQAMMKDVSGNLKGLVERFSSEKNFSIRKDIVDQIILAWTGSDRYSADDRGGYALDARKIFAVEAFVGEGFIQGSGTNGGLRDPGPAASIELGNAFGMISDYYYSLLSLQTHYSKYTGQALVAPNSGDYVVDSSAIVQSLRADYDRGDISLEEISVYFKSLKDIGEYGARVLASVRQVGGGDGDFGLLIGLAGLSSNIGTSGADSLYSNSSSGSYLMGFGGGDSLYGGGGSDSLDGGSGNDYLNAGESSDIYRFSRGWGQDSINNYDVSSDKTDTI